MSSLRPSPSPSVPSSSVPSSPAPASVSRAPPSLCIPADDLEVLASLCSSVAAFADTADEAAWLAARASLACGLPALVAGRPCAASYAPFEGRWAVGVAGPWGLALRVAGDVVDTAAGPVRVLVHGGVA